jgi:uncharacterized protein YjbI with pentapeptide repeats
MWRYSNNRKDKDIELFRKKLKEKLGRGDYDFRNYFFPERVNFSSREFDDYADFGGATFQQDADFGGATFQQNADFRDVKFQNAYFNEAIFRDNAIFSRAEFEKDIIFSGTEFQYHVDFERTIFKKDVIFDRVVFQDNAYFDRDTFQSASFSEVTFQKDAVFNKATFQNAYFDEATFRNAYFGLTTFQKDAVFNKATFQNAYFDEASFQDNAEFNEATFQKDAVFNKATFQNAYFDEAIFLDNVGFDGTKFKNASFKRTKFKNASFKRTKFKNASFREAVIERNLKLTHSPGINRLNFQNTQFLFRGNITADLSRAKFHEADLENVAFTNCKWPKRLYEEEHMKEEHLSFKELKIIYRDLKQNMQRNGNYSRAGIFFYREMEMKRKGTKKKRDRLWLELYRLLAGYGERPLHTIAVSGLVVLIFALLYVGLGCIQCDLDPMKNPSLSQEIIDAIYFSFVTFTTLGLGDVQPSTNLGKALICGEAVIGAFLIALFVVVFVRKMMR